MEPVETLKGRKAAAIRYGDHETAAEADLGLRAYKIAKVIRVDRDRHPETPLPPATVKALCDMLTGGAA